MVEKKSLSPRQEKASINVMRNIFMGVPFSISLDQIKRFFFIHPLGQSVKELYSGRWGWGWGFNAAISPVFPIAGYVRHGSRTNR